MDDRTARDVLSAEFDVPRETLDEIDRFVVFLREECAGQNLVSRSTLDQIWSRHILDSVQLLSFAPTPSAWLDLGTGAGFPGLIVGLLQTGTTTLVEERRLRIDFLNRAVALLGAGGRINVAGRRAERLPEAKYDVISARAFAPLTRLFELSHRFSTEKSRWVLPKGRNAQSELEEAKSSWQGEFRLEPSRTSEDAYILIAEKVRPRSKGSTAR